MDLRDDPLTAVLLAITVQDNVAHLELSRIDFDKCPLSIDWNDVPVCQSVRHSLTIGERNGDLLGHVVRFLGILLHLSAVIALVSDLLSAGLARLRIDDKNFVTQFDF